MKKTALLLFMLFAFVMKAQEMVLLGESTEDKFKVYIYPKTVIESERRGYITARFLYEHSIPQKLPSGKYYVKAEKEELINCKKNKMGDKDMMFYTQNIILASIVLEENRVDLFQVKPNTIEEKMIKAACHIYDSISNQKQE